MSAILQFVELVKTPNTKAETSKPIVLECNAHSGLTCSVRILGIAYHLVLQNQLLAKTSKSREKEIKATRGRYPCLT